MNFDTVMHTGIDARGEYCSANRELPYVIDVIRAWKTECRPTTAQEALLWQWCAAARRVYNWAVAERIANYRAIDAAKLAGEEPPKRLSKFDQTRALTALIHGGDPLRLADIPAVTREFAVQDADLAFQAFFRKLKARQTPMRKGAKRALAKQYGAPDHWPKLDGVDLWSKLQGWPRFKSARDFHHAFRVRSSLKSDGWTVKIPKMPALRLKETGYFPDAHPATLNTVTVSWSAGRWYVALNADWQIELTGSPPAASCRIDFDLPGYCRIETDVGTELHSAPQPGAGAVSAALDGRIDVPAVSPYRAELKRLRRLSRAFSRQAYDSETKRESKRRASTRLKLQKLHARIERRRAYAIHALSTDIVRRFGTIIVTRPDLKLDKKEDAQARADAAWGEFLRQLKYKSEWRGSTYVEKGADGQEL